MKTSTNSTKISSKRVLCLSIEQMEKAIEVSNGNLHAACRLFKYADGTPVGWTSFYYYVRKYNLHLQLDRYREKIAYDALDALCVASKDNWRAALALLDRFGKYIGVNRELTITQRQEEQLHIDKIARYEEYKLHGNPDYLTRLDNEN